jgi:hypothetical protein
MRIHKTCSLSSRNSLISHSCTSRAAPTMRTITLLWVLLGCLVWISCITTCNAQGGGREESGEEQTSLGAVAPRSYDHVFQLVKPDPTHTKLEINYEGAEILNSITQKVMLISPPFYSFPLLSIHFPSFLFISPPFYSFPFLFPSSFPFFFSLSSFPFLLFPFFFSLSPFLLLSLYR